MVLAMGPLNARPTRSDIQHSSPNSAQAALPVITTPTCVTLATMWSSVKGRLDSNATKPTVCRASAPMFKSLIKVGTPVKGDSASGLTTCLLRDRDRFRREFGCDAEEGDYLVVEFLRAAQVIVVQGDRRRSSFTDGRSQLDHAELMNPAHDIRC